MKLKNFEDVNVLCTCFVKEFGLPERTTFTFAKQQAAMQ